MSAIAQNKRRGLIVIGLLVLTLVVGSFALPGLGDMEDRGVGIIEFELSRTEAKASEYYGTLGEEGRDGARESLYWDFPYLIAYAFFFAAWVLVIAARAAERGMAKLASWGRPLALGAFIGAGADAVENVALLRVLDGHTDQPWPGIAFSFATLKFALLIAATLYAVVGFLLTLRARRADPDPHPA